jgi:hypothetical protein
LFHSNEKLVENLGINDRWIVSTRVLAVLGRTERTIIERKEVRNQIEPAQKVQPASKTDPVIKSQAITFSRFHSLQNVIIALERLTLLLKTDILFNNGNNVTIPESQGIRDLIHQLHKARKVAQ